MAVAHNVLALLLRDAAPGIVALVKLWECRDHMALLTKRGVSDAVPTLHPQNIFGSPMKRPHESSVHPPKAIYRGGMASVPAGRK